VKTAPPTSQTDASGGDAKYAGGFCGLTDRVVFNPAFTCHITAETSPVRIDFKEHRGNRCRVFNVKLTSPKAFKNPVVVSAELTFTLAFSPQHTDCRERGIPDFAGSQNY
jgi:hypothetical protein